MSARSFAVPDASQPLPLVVEIAQRVISEYDEAIAGLISALARASARTQFAVAKVPMQLRAGFSSLDVTIRSEPSKHRRERKPRSCSGFNERS